MIGPILEYRHITSSDAGQTTDSSANSHPSSPMNCQAQQCPGNCQDDHDTQRHRRR
jgi:hypothetical protein